MSTFIFVFFFILRLSFKCIGFEKLERIASKIESNLSLKKPLELDLLHLDEFKYQMKIFDMIPYFTYESMTITNTPTKEEIMYKQFHISFFFQFSLTENNPYHTSILRQMTADQTYETILSREEDNSFKFQFKPLSIFLLGTSDLFNYAIGEVLERNLQDITNFFYNARDNFFTSALSLYPPSFTVYYFNQFINNLIKSNKFSFIGGPGRFITIKFISITYQRVKKINKFAAIFIWVEFVVDFYYNDQEIRTSASAYQIEFGQMAVGPINVSHGNYSRELSQIIKKVFDGEFKKYEYHTKYQDSNEIIDKMS